MDNINITSLDDIELIRCIIKKEKPDHFKAISHQKEKFRIAKNKISKNFEIGYDKTFHAISKTEGRILRKTTYYPISHEQYLKLKEELGGKNEL